MLGLVPAGGQFPPALDEVQPYVVVGPMTRYASDLKLVLSALIGKEATHKLNLFNQVSLLKIFIMQHAFLFKRNVKSLFTLDLSSFLSLD